MTPRVATTLKAPARTTLNRTLIALACFGTLAALTAGSILTGSDFRVGFLFFPTVAVAAWWLDRKVAVVYAAIAALALVVHDAILSPEDSIVVAVWNDFTRAVTLMAAAVFVSWLRSSLDVSAQDRERLFRLAVTDSLTGLYNRRFLMEHLNIVHSAAERSGRPYAVLAIDVDGLKHLNDWLGHKVGDTALVALAADISSNVRDGDVVVRTGGDEFLVLMPDQSAAGAAQVATRILGITGAKRPSMAQRVTGVSIGIAAWKPGATAEQLLRTADTLMYASKQRGGACFSQDAE